MPGRGSLWQRAGREPGGELGGINLTADFGRNLGVAAIYSRAHQCGYLTKGDCDRNPNRRRAEANGQHGKKLRDIGAGLTAVQRLDKVISPNGLRVRCGQRRGERAADPDEPRFGGWCNGSTADFGSACSGSNPDPPVFTESAPPVMIQAVRFYGGRAGWYHCAAWR